MTKKIIPIHIFLFFLLRTAAISAQDIPGTTWEHSKDPTLSGWNIKRFDTLRKYIIDSTHITGFMIVDKGKVVFEYGDLEENSYIASCRKSVLSMIYGEHVKSGEIDLTKSLKDLGIDDIGGLLPIEKEATVKDIISARSGVFHPASNPGGFEKYTPARGSVKHGEYWLYNNWDFNVAGYIFEKETHRNIYDEIERILAVPLHMEDWKRSLQHKDGDTAKSIYEAYPVWFSTRDMARIGLLMLGNGKWGDKQIIDEHWIRDMLEPRTGYEEVNRHLPPFRKADYHFGYGYMWWLWQNMPDKRFQGSYAALGHMGQSIAVFPAIQTVVVYKTKAAYERTTSDVARFKVIELTVNAFEGNHNQ